ncbi:MAG: phosphoribosylglycinamide formyltransferase [Leptolinea sp.]|nr:phosphoribosylglycinamide formyltransferase [Leptolinea sp.]
MKKASLVILISGNGSNLQVILDACQSGLLKADVTAVISNRQDAYGLVRARNAGVPAILKHADKRVDRKEFDSELAELVDGYHPDLIILAGWMRILTIAFIRRFPQRIINLHPALPGTFPGVHAIERAFDAYQRGEITQTGVMVHYVPDEGVDIGPVITRQVVPIYPSDTIDDLEERVHVCEHELLIETIQKLVGQMEEGHA